MHNQAQSGLGNKAIASKNVVCYKSCTMLGLCSALYKLQLYRWWKYSGTRIYLNTVTVVVSSQGVFLNRDSTVNCMKQVPMILDSFLWYGCNTGGLRIIEKSFAICKSRPHQAPMRHLRHFSVSKNGIYFSSFTTYTLPQNIYDKEKQYRIIASKTVIFTHIWCIFLQS